MVEENNSGLDNFLAEGEVSSPQTSSALQTANRPKLKKIKRPKIRPMAGAPVAPQKIEPIETAKDEENSLQNTESFNEAEQNFTGTNLVTATDAQDLVRENEFNNSYILDNLPPDLDYNKL